MKNHILSQQYKYGRAEDSAAGHQTCCQPCHEKQTLKQGERWGGRWTISNSHASQISWYGLLLCTSITNMKVLCHYAGSSSLSRSTSMHVHHRYLGPSSLCRSFSIMHVHSTLIRNHAPIGENLHYTLVVDKIPVLFNK
jgi:hypothetical protein